MLSFWLLVALLSLGTTLLVVWPLVGRARSQAMADERERRLAVYRDRRRELEADRAAGRLTDAEAEAAVAELAADVARQFGEDLDRAQPAPASGGADPVARAGSGRRLGVAIALALALPLGGIGVYQFLGSPLLVEVDPSALDRPPTEAEIARFVADLEARTRSNPDDGEAWAVLGQTYKFQGRHAEAVTAFAQASRRLAPDARFLTEYAEAIALARDGDFSGEPTALLRQALALAPDEPKTVGLMGAAQFRAGNLPEARRLIAKLLDGMPADAPQAQPLRAVIAEIDRQLAAAPGPRPLPGGAPDAPAATSVAPAPRTGTPDPAGAIRGRVEIDDALRARLRGGETLFVSARLVQGPRQPLAAVRSTAAPFPVAFALDDTMAMDPSRRLSGADEVVVEARISRSGNAIREAGDLIGTSAPVRPGAREVVVRIDRVVEAR